MDCRRAAEVHEQYPGVGRKVTLLRKLAQATKRLALVDRIGK